jgi:hypothetical protein
MAAVATMGGSGGLFVGEDKLCRLELLDADDVPVDMVGWTIALVVHSKKGDTLVNELASVEGTYNATRSVNTQRAVVTLTDTEMAIPPGVHQHSWKRTDDGSETILAYGDFIVERTTQT